LPVEDECHDESVTNTEIHHWDPPYTSGGAPGSNGLEYGFDDNHKLLNLSPEKPTLINNQCGQVSEPKVQSTEPETNLVESSTPPQSSFDYILKRLAEAMGPQVVINSNTKPEVYHHEEVPEESAESFFEKAKEIMEEEILVKMKVPEMGENKDDKSETPPRRVLGRGRARRRDAEL